MRSGTHTRSRLISLAPALIVTVLLSLAAPAPTASAQTGPILNEVAKLLASDGAAGDGFGHSVAVDGDTAVVGGPYDNDNGIDSGAAYVFMRNPDDGAWAQQAKLLANDGAAADLFGFSVAVSGATVVIGAFRDNDNGLSSGSAYVFVRDAAGVWTQQAKLLASDGAPDDFFGHFVDVSGDTAVVGAHGAGIVGAAYVFVRAPDGMGGFVWTQQAKLLASNGVGGEEFGHSVAVNADTVVIGAPAADTCPNHPNPRPDCNSGSGYVFVRDADGVWTQQAMLLPQDGACGDYLGYSVAVNADTAIVGAPFNSDNGGTAGTAYVFVRDAGGVWTQQAKLLASGGAAGDFFGRSVTVNGDTAVVGAPFVDSPAGNPGSAYIFVRSGAGVWSQQAKLLATDGAPDDQFGFSVALDSATAFTGAFKDDDNGSLSGSAYIFDLNTNAADLDGDGVVDGADLAALLTQWGTNGPADLNNDGVVNGADLAQLLSNWGPVN